MFGRAMWLWVAGRRLAQALRRERA